MPRSHRSLSRLSLGAMRSIDVREAVRAAAFWLAIGIPVAYVPLLAYGLSGWAAVLFVGLLVVNAIALVYGHDYGR